MSAVPGAALLFHTDPGLFHEMHLQLSMLLLLPVGFHMRRNLTDFTA